MSRKRKVKTGAHNSGANKSKHWIDSGLLPSRPDRVTGSTGRYIIELGVPADMEQWTESDLRMVKQRVEFEISDEDLNAWDELATMNGFKTLLSTTVKDAVVAVENGTGAAASSNGKSASELLAEKMVALKANLSATLMKFQR